MDRIYSDNFWHLRKQVNKKESKKKKERFHGHYFKYNIYVVATAMEIISVAWQRSI